MRPRALVGSVALVPLLVSCMPYVLPSAETLCSQESPAAGCTELPSVALAIKNIEGSRATVKEKLESNIRVSRGLDYATFGFVTAFAVKGMHEAAIGAGAKNLAMAGGASYTAGRLLFPASSEELYLSAHSALTCVVGRGSSLIGVFEQAKKLIESINSDAHRVKTSECIDKLGDELVNEFDVAHAKASSVKETILSADAAVGAQLSAAHTHILGALNSQLMAQRPNAEAILSAGSGITSIASGLMASRGLAAPRASAPSVATSGFPANGERQSMECHLSRETARMQITSLNGVATALKSAYNAIGDLKDGCTVPTAAIVPLAIAQNSVTLAPGTSINLVYSGGRPPIRAEWTDTIPKSEQLTLTPLPGSNMFQIARPPQDKTDDVFKLRVFDSGVIPTSIEVGVTATPPPAK